jgi:hypothetical protein
VNGNITIVCTDPSAYHRYDLVPLTGIAFVAREPAKTGLYVTLSCYYYRATSGTPVTVLEPFGSFTTGIFATHGFNGDDVHKVANHPALAALADLTDTYLSDWVLSMHDVFETFLTNFLPVFIALDAEDPGILSFPDGTSWSALHSRSWFRSGAGSLRRRKR